MTSMTLGLNQKSNHDEDRIKFLVQVQLDPVLSSDSILEMTYAKKLVFPSFSRGNIFAQCYHVLDILLKCRIIYVNFQLSPPIR